MNKLWEKIKKGKEKIKGIIQKQNGKSFVRKYRKTCSKVLIGIALLSLPVLASHSKHQKQTNQKTIENIIEVPENENIKINDEIKVEANTKIYTNQYDATQKTNGSKPYFNNDTNRKIEQVTIQTIDGRLVQTNDETLKETLLNEGGTITAYLVSNEYGIEGYYNVSNVQTTLRQQQIDELRQARIDLLESRTVIFKDKVKTLN